MSVLVPGHAGYPQRLCALTCDKELHVRGQISEARAVAIVGARAATITAMGRAHALAKHLACHGVHVVSPHPESGSVSPTQIPLHMC